MRAVSKAFATFTVLMAAFCMTNSVVWSRDDAGSGNPSMLRINESAGGSTITTAVGDLFEVSLDENPTTGYSWTTDSTGDPACKLVDDAFDAPEAAGPDGTSIAGRGGVRRLLFQANDLGTGEIRLSYRRVWEKDVAPIRTFTLAVRVEGARLAPGSVASFDGTANGTETALSVGQLFEVILEENVTTGFTWVIESEGAPACDKIDDVSVSGTGLVGASGYSKLLFRAKEAGTGVISLAYRRPWEKEAAPERTFTLTIKVTGASVQALSFTPRMVKGDLNGDGAVDITDAIRVLRIALGLSAS